MARQRIDRESTSIEISTSPTESNAALAHRYANDDAAAFADLVSRYHEFVFRICFGILRHRQDAEDATQETFTRVARYLHRWDPRRPLEPWLATVAGNRSRTQLSRRRLHAPLGSVEEPQSDHTGQVHAAEAMREEIELAMEKLAPRAREAFLLFHDHTMSYAEIAETMNCPIGTVKTLVHRARIAMISHLRNRDVVLPPLPSQHAPAREVER